MADNLPDASIDPPPDPPGAIGGLLPSVRLSQRALAQGWNVPESIRGPIIDRLAAIATNPDAKPRVAMMAAKTLMSASKITLDCIGVAIAAETHEELKARLEAMEERLDGEHGSL